MEFIEEIDIKEEVDMDSDPEGQHDFIPDCNDWKLNSNVESRYTLNDGMKDLPSEQQFHGNTESQSTRGLGDGMCIDPVTRVHHVDLDLSDMFAKRKTIKAEPADVEMNLGDPLALCDIKDCPAESEIEFGFCQPSNIIVKKSQKVTRPGQKQYKCDLCGKDFGFRSALARHKMMHVADKPHKCEECGRGFGRNYDLTQHKRTHTGVKPHMCDVCGLSFARNSDLTQHRMTHSGEKPYSCDVCGISFARNSDLTRHKMIHSGEKFHVCDLCGMNFARIHHLTQHMLTHTGEKPYRCEECGMEFSRLTNLTRHKVTHAVKYNSSVTHADVVLP